MPRDANFAVESALNEAPRCIYCGRSTVEDQSGGWFVSEATVSSIEAATDVTDLARKACDGAAFSRQVGVERFFRGARRCYDGCYSLTMPVTNDFREFVLEQLGRVVDISWKRMFGGVGLYAEETFFALIDDDIVYFKVGDENRSDFETAGARAFRPYGDDRTSMNYYALPIGALEDVDELRGWTEKSVAAARGAAAKKRRKKSP